MSKHFQIGYINISASVYVLHYAVSEESEILFLFIKLKIWDHLHSDNEQKSDVILFFNHLTLSDSQHLLISSG